MSKNLDMQLGMELANLKHALCMRKPDDIRAIMVEVRNLRSLIDKRDEKMRLRRGRHHE